MWPNHYNDDDTIYYTSCYGNTNHGFIFGGDDYDKIENAHGRKSYAGERSQLTNAARKRKAEKRKMAKQSRKTNKRG